jgi:hypothetical protein
MRYNYCNVEPSSDIDNKVAHSQAQQTHENDKILQSLLRINQKTGKDQNEHHDVNQY